jgi:hypothetical protein
MSPVEIDALYVFATVRRVEASVLVRAIVMRAIRREARRMRGSQEAK